MLQGEKSSKSHLAFWAPKLVQKSLKSLPRGQSTVNFAGSFFGSIFEFPPVPLRKHFTTHSGNLLNYFGHLSQGLVWNLFWGLVLDHFLNPPNPQNSNSVWDVLRFLGCEGKGCVTQNCLKKGAKRESKTLPDPTKTCQQTAHKIDPRG